MSKRVVAVFTGNRSEYSLQLPLLAAIRSSLNLSYRLIVAGLNHDESFKSTVKIIEKDGFEIFAKVKLDIPTSSTSATASAIGQCVIQMTDILKDLQPDFNVVYGDRFEAFGAVIASTQLNIPTAHIEGGDITQGGALDDSVRHAMSKLSHIHFTTNSDSSQRLLAMGEEPWRVHTVGFPAIDLIEKNNFASKQEIYEKLSISADRPLIVFTQHSVTTEFQRAGEQVQPSLAALKYFADKGVQVVITYPNNDAGSSLIIKELEKLNKHPNIKLHKSLGHYLYHGLLALSLDENAQVVCVGNSSSGLKETPAFCCPAVDIGSRQEGRLKGKNVISVDYDINQIKSAIEVAFFDKKFKNICKSTSNPYGIGKAGVKMSTVLSSISLDDLLIRKKMTIT